MSLQVETLEHNMAKITLEASEAQLEEAIEQVYRREKNSISLPGFRKGKAPRKMIEKMYGKDVFTEQAANDLIPRIYDAMLAEEKELDIVSSPQIEVTQLEQGKPLVFTAQVALKPPVTLGDYKGLPVAKRETAVSEEEVQQAMEQERERHGRLIEITDRPAENGDMVRLDFSGTIDGEPFEGGESRNYPLKIGNGAFIPGFEEQLVGMSPGEEREITVTFPEDYHAENLRGKEAVFACTLQKINQKELPELDDEFASDVSDFDTLQEYKDNLRENLTKQKEENVRRQKEDEALNEAIERAQMDIPDPMVESRIDQMVDDFARQLASQGMNMEQYMQYTGATAESFRASMKPEALHRVKANLVLDAIARTENIEITEERLEEELDKMAKSYDMEKDKLKELLGEEQLESTKANMALTDALKLIADAAAEVEKKETAAEEAAPAAKEEEKE